MRHKAEVIYLMHLSALVWGASDYALQTSIRWADSWTQDFPTTNI